MLQSVNAPVGIPSGSPRPADVVSDEQIRALVEAADRLGRRQRERCADAGSPAADKRLRNLDWAVHAGRLALADRAARSQTSTARSAQRRWGQL